MVLPKSLNRVAAAALLCAVTLMSACDEETLEPPTAANVASDAQGLFTRYVAMGNSITQGIQSAGANDSTQLKAYPVLLAAQMGLDVPTIANPVTREFNVPLLLGPGCPPPYTDIWTQTRIGGLPDDFCALRTHPIPEYFNNVAFAGATVQEQYTYYDPATRPANTDVYKTFLLGGSTPVDVVRDMQATFLTVWVGSTDIDDALTDTDNPGSPDLYPTAQEFADAYAVLMDSITAIQSIEGAVLIGAINVVNAPYVSPGPVYVQAAQAIPTLTADPNCMLTTTIPGTTTAVPSYVPFHYGAVLMAQASAGVPTTLDCSVDQVITSDEAAAMVVAVMGYNTAIEAAAAAAEWPYWDPNELLGGLQALYPACLAGNDCPILLFPAFNPTDPQHATEPFGWALSLDGLHPSDRAHVMVTDALIEVINAEYDAAIPTISQ